MPISWSDFGSSASHYLLARSEKNMKGSISPTGLCTSTIRSLLTVLANYSSPSSKRDRHRINICNADPRISGSRPIVDMLNLEGLEDQHLRDAWTVEELCVRTILYLRVWLQDQEQFQTSSDRLLRVALIERMGPSDYNYLAC